MAISGAASQGKHTTSREAGSGKRPERPRGMPRRVRVSARELTYFLSQLSLMIEVGTPLNVSVSTLASQTRNPALQAALQDVARRLEEGRQLSEALGQYPSIFDGIFVSMVRAGETGGFLRETLDRLAEIIEKRDALTRQLMAALTYPAILCVVATGVVIFIVTGVLPKFMVLFAGREHLLPFTTRFLIAASDSLRNFWWAYLTAVATLVVAGRAFAVTSAGRRLRDRILVRGPLISGVYNKICTCNLLRMIGLLLQSRVPLLEALEVTRMTTASQHYRAFVDSISERVRQGGRLGHAFAENDAIPATVRQMVETAEEAGNLYPVMLKLADFYDREITQDLKTLAALIEPMALVILGAVVGMIVSSVILPVFKLAHTMT